MENAYPLDKLVFNFLPDGLPEPDVNGETTDQVTANDVYRQAYRMVYNRWPRHDLGRKWQNATANAKLAQMDFKTFCLFIITGFAITHQTTDFFPTNLTAPSSIGKVESYRKACMNKFGASDARSLGLMLNVEFHDIDEEMLLSEVNFGRYIVGNYKHHGSDRCKEVYDFDEISFSPYWLAIEGTYHDFVFKPYLKKAIESTPFNKNKLGTDAQLRHRHLVTQVISALKRKSHLASTIFCSRSRIMPKAVNDVLTRNGIKTTVPIAETVNVDNAFEFWKHLGQFIKDYQWPR